MKQTKRLMSLFLSVVMLISITTGLDFSSYANTNGVWEYTVNNGNATIYKYNGKGSNITIPSKIDGYNVTSIKGYEHVDGYAGSTRNIFYDCKGKINVTISNGIKTIDESAFDGCKNLISIVIPNSVTKIGFRAFGWCENLVNLTMSSKLKTIDDCAFIACYKIKNISIPKTVTKIGESAFNSCESLSGKIVIPNGVKNIEDGTFTGCYNISQIIIPNGVKSIEVDAFAGCKSLKTLNIPDSVTSFKDELYYCKGLTSITVGAKNKNYSSKNGILFNKKKTKIIKYPSSKSGKSYTVPSNVTSINEIAFEYCKNLTEIKVAKKNKKYTSKDGVLYTKDKKTLLQYPCGSARKTYTIPEGTKIIKGFSGSKIHSVIVPKSTTWFFNQEFTDCKSFTDVYYKSSKKNWENITGGASVFLYDVKYIPEPKIHYNYKIHKHKWNKGKVTKKATYTSTGLKEYKCSVGKETRTDIIPKLKLSKPGSVKIKAISKGFKLSWKKNTKATGYEIQYSTDSKFKKSVKKISISKNNTTSKTVKKLKKNKKYYVRIRSYKTVKKNGKNVKVYSSWVSKSIKTK